MASNYVKLDALKVADLEQLTLVSIEAPAALAKSSVLFI